MIMIIFIMMMMMIMIMIILMLTITNKIPQQDAVGGRSESEQRIRDFALQS